MTIADRTAGLVSDLLARDGTPRAVEVSTPLTEAGVSSLTLVNLMLAVEAEFDVFIPPARVTPASFRSVATIAALVEDLRRAEVA